jgi:cysteine synthase
MRTLLLSLSKNILAKYEGSNGQICHKQRSGEWIIQDAYQRGVDLSRVTERTSGSMAIGIVRPVCKLGGTCNFVSVGQPDPLVLSYVQAHRGTFTVVNSNAERISALQALVAEGWWTADQHQNAKFVDAFELTLGAELLLDLKEAGVPVAEIAFIVAPVGTGGTLAGVARCLRKAGGNLKAIGVEPTWSVVHGQPPSWVPMGLKVPGAGSTDEICETLKFALRTEIDDIVPFPALYGAREMASSFTNGITTCGMSGGLALSFARQVLEPVCTDGRRILVIIPDSALRYVHQLSIASTIFQPTLLTR